METTKARSYLAYDFHSCAMLYFSFAWVVRLRMWFLGVSMKAQSAAAYGFLLKSLLVLQTYSRGQKLEKSALTYPKDLENRASSRIRFVAMAFALSPLSPKQLKPKTLNPKYTLLANCCSLSSAPCAAPHTSTRPSDPKLETPGSPCKSSVEYCHMWSFTVRSAENLSQHIKKT